MSLERYDMIVVTRDNSEISIFGWNTFRVLATPQIISIYLTIGRGPEILGRTTLQPTYKPLSGKNIDSQPLGRPLQPRCNQRESCLEI